MKRAIFLFLLIVSCLTINPAAFSQSDANPKATSDAKKTCPFSIVGLWRSEATTQANPIFFNFSPEGWVSLLTHSADALPQDFEIITAVNYKLDNPSRPKRIEFTAWRGNDAFQPGITSNEITEYSDDSFTTLDHTSAQKTRWVRERTHRYFLALAARSGTPQHGGPAFAMLTTLDGRQTKVEALGVQMTKDAESNILPVFGLIPAELYEQVAADSDERKKDGKDKNMMMRLELTAAEFERIHKVFEVWKKYVKTSALPHSDPYLNGMEFLRKAVEPLNRCGERLKLDKLNPSLDRPVTKENLREQPLEFIRAIRKNNEDLHVPDAFFPWGWRPMLQLSAP
jgi:hypothetical protein